MQQQTLLPLGSFTLGANNYIGQLSGNFGTYFSTAVSEPTLGWTYALDLSGNAAGFLCDDNDSTNMQGEVPWKTIFNFYDMGRSGYWDVKLLSSGVCYLYETKDFIDGELVSVTNRIPQRPYTLGGLRGDAKVMGTDSYGSRSFKSAFWVSARDSGGNINKILAHEGSHSTSYSNIVEYSSSVAKTEYEAGECPLTNIYYCSSGVSTGRNRYLRCSELYIIPTYYLYDYSLDISKTDGIASVVFRQAVPIDYDSSDYATTEYTTSGKDNGSYLNCLDEINGNVFVRATVSDGYEFVGWYDMYTDELLSTDLEAQIRLTDRTSDVALLCAARKANLYIGVQKPKEIYIGENKVDAVYVGDEKVWSTL